MTDVQEDINPILRNYNHFANRFYPKLEKSYKCGFVFSPVSVHTLLSLLLQGSEDYTKTVLKESLGFYDDEVAVNYENTIRHLNSVKDLQIANKVLLSKTYEPKEPFVVVAANNFFADVEIFEDDGNEAAKSMEVWLEEKTNGKVGGLEVTSSINNAFYCHSKWSQVYDFQETKKENFYLSDEDTVDVQMMKTKKQVNYKLDDFLDATILELPCANNDISLVIVLPNKNGGIEELERKLKNINLGDICEGVSPSEINVSIPKFKAQSTVDFGHIFKKTHLGSCIFDDYSNFSSISNSPVSLAVTKVTEKTFIEFNEEGIEAAAVTNCQLVLSRPIIYEMDIKATVLHRFAKTLITSKVKNIEKLARTMTFSVVLPENAFISEFVMEVDGKSYKSFVKEKKEAKNIFDQAVARGQGAGHVAVSARDSNVFSVDVNIEPNSSAAFLLAYEELLERRYEQYELVLNIHPKQMVKNLNVLVEIKENKPLKYVKTPAIRSGKELKEENKKLEPSSIIQMKNAVEAVVKFNPSLEEQKKLACELGENDFNGLCGQFVVQYDVERDSKGGEVLVQDGYFVHFFAPSELHPLAKHVVFVLDTSSSMAGLKIKQLQDAMCSILSQIRQNDLVDIVEFNSNVIVWDVNSVSKNIIKCDFDENYEKPFDKLKKIKFPTPRPADEDLINKAKKIIQKMKADMCTNIIAALVVSLYLVKLGQEKFANRSVIYQPIVIFLTDGQPTDYVTSPGGITEIVTKLNMENNKAPIFSLSFGDGADKEFLRQFSLKNMGLSKHIYEAADASLQLQQFYKQISCPLLTNILFKYGTGAEEVTKYQFPIFFSGSELVVSGKCTDVSTTTTVNCCGPNGMVELRPTIANSVTSLDRLWAFLTVKQLLEERHTANEINKAKLAERALGLALKYSFVTDVSSLVVVKPSASDDPKDALSVSVPEENGSRLEECGGADGYEDDDYRVLMPLCDEGREAGIATLCSLDLGPSDARILRLSALAHDLLGNNSQCDDVFESYNCIAMCDTKKALKYQSHRRFSAGRNIMKFGKSGIKWLKSAFSSFDHERDYSIVEPVVVEEEAEAKTAPIIPQDLLIDHPFVIILLLKEGNRRVVLFAGRICQPEY